MNFWYGFVIGMLAGIGVCAGSIALVIRRVRRRFQLGLKNALLVQQQVGAVEMPATKEMYEAMIKKEREKQQ